MDTPPYIIEDCARILPTKMHVLASPATCAHDAGGRPPRALSVRRCSDEGVSLRPLRSPRVLREHSVRQLRANPRLPAGCDGDGVARTGRQRQVVVAAARGQRSVVPPLPELPRRGYLQL